MFTSGTSRRRQEILPRLQNTDQHNVGEKPQASKKRSLPTRDEAAYGESERKGCCEVAKIVGRHYMAYGLGWLHNLA